MKNNIAIEELAEAVAVPPAAYERAEKRYLDLGDWFDSDRAESSDFSPHIYPQGSFRLGTAIRPIADNGDYDLDLGSRLRAGITKSSMSQKGLKELIGRDLEAYRVARGIKAPLEPKHRCWRLQYADDMNFHMDIVPSIPVTDNRRGLIREAMLEKSIDSSIIENVVALAGNITNDTIPSYPVISGDWLVSNSEGYALWFEAMAKDSSMKLLEEARAQVDPLPKKTLNTPLQKAVMLLKAHRDKMFEDNPDSKPISVILTTLAARAYEGQGNLTEALLGILTRMGSLVPEMAPYVYNPVNPVEDFGDKWDDPKYSHLNLKENFKNWLKKAQEDFQTLYGTEDILLLESTASKAFGKALPKASEAITEHQTLSNLRKKSGLLKTGAKTSTAGIIGSTGVTNKAHGFYGE